METLPNQPTTTSPDCTPGVRTRSIHSSRSKKPVCQPAVRIVPHFVGCLVFVRQHTQWPHGARAKCPCGPAPCGLNPKATVTPAPYESRKEETQLDEPGGAHNKKSTDPELIQSTKRSNTSEQASNFGNTHTIPRRRAGLKLDTNVVLALEAGNLVNGAHLWKR